MMIHPMTLVPLVGLRMLFAPQPAFRLAGIAGVVVTLTVAATAMAAWLLLSIAQSRQTASGSCRIGVAVDVVRQRFARGEIDVVECDRLVKGLIRSP